MNLGGQEYFDWRDRQPGEPDPDVEQPVQKLTAWERRRLERDAKRAHLAQQIADGSLTVRRATAAELEQLRADRDRHLAEHPDAAEKSERVAAKLRGELARPKPAEPPKPPKTCTQCGAEFTSRNAGQRMCSRKCVTDSQRRPVETQPSPSPQPKPKPKAERAIPVQLVCAHCGKTFERPKKRANRTFCSRSCSITARHAARRAA